MWRKNFPFLILFVGVVAVTLLHSATTQSLSEEKADLVLNEHSTIFFTQDEEEEEFNANETNALLESNDPRHIAFYLYPDSENNTDNDVILLWDTESLQGSRYDTNKTPLLFIHGFTNNYTTRYSQTMKNEFLEKGFAKIHNLIVVDWGKLATPANLTAWLSQIKDPLKDLYYKASVRNVPIAGGVVAQFIAFLVSEKRVESPSSVTLLGFSLGAQISGFAGAFVKQNLTTPIGRITGFDPAGPLFQHVGPEQRLDPTDASFVDIVHSNQGQDGYYGTCGTADFYPNGGGPTQPDCVQDVLGVVPNTITGSCAHNRAWIYYLKALSENYTACQCSSFVNIFCRAVCKEKARFGYYSPLTAAGSYYFDIFAKEKNTDDE